MRRSNSLFSPSTRFAGDRIWGSTATSRSRTVQQSPTQTDPSALTVLAQLLKDKDEQLAKARDGLVTALIDKDKVKDELLAAVRKGKENEVQVAILRNQLQSVNLQFLIKCHAVSIRASLGAFSCSKS
ncbi:UNVERIFIED_CONTAM: hypothetical protein HDU68_001810 [Siphonaria sp. JEL0065]|nr:hypothetical protein HDU68_001810 [Siphonaria sp. JEL0065]